MVSAEVEEVVDRIVGGQEPLSLWGKLNRFICRSRRLVGWCEFSARLFKPFVTVLGPSGNTLRAVPRHDLPLGRVLGRAV